MTIKKRARARVIAPLAALAVLGTAGIASAVALTGGDDGSFVVSAVAAAPVLPGGTVSQPLAGLWSGSQVSTWTKVAGSDWLSVTGEGTVTGTAPVGDAAGAGSSVVTVQADGGPTIQVTVSVVAAAQPQRVEAASWNLGDAGAQASWSAQHKELSAIIAEGVQVVGLQETGGTAAHELAGDLGWYSWQSSSDEGGGDLGLISAYPISDVTAPTATVPAAAATLDVNGQHVRVWVTHLDESDYGPDRACSSGASGLVAHEAGTTRATQAAAVVAAMSGDLTAASGASGTPVLMLGDLASPAAADWTAGTSAAHCDAGAVAWPVPAAFTSAGLTDSYRSAYPDPAAHPGATWPLGAPASDGSAAPDDTESDRVDYVDYAGPLSLVGAESYTTGPATWPSDHAAAIALLALTAPHAATAPAGTIDTPPTSGQPAPAPTPAPSTAPTTLTPGRLAITGTATVGGSVRASATAWPSGTTFTYQWYADGLPLGGATRASYSPAAAVLGHQLTLRVTARAGQRSAVVSVPGPKVRAGSLRHAVPHITGTVRAGRTLTARPGSWPGARLAYQWYAGGHPIKGATKRTLRLTRAQHGQRVTVRVTGHRAGYITLTVASGATTPVS